MNVCLHLLIAVVFWPPYAAHIIIEIAHKRQQETKDINDDQDECTDKNVVSHDQLYSRVWFNDDILDIDTGSLMSSISEHSTKDHLPVKGVSVLGQLEDVSVTATATGTATGTTCTNTEQGWVPFSTLLDKLEKSAISFDKYAAQCPKDED